MAKRLISTGIGIIILLLVMISNNVYIFNFALTVIAIMGLSEFYNSFKKKNIKADALIGYISAIGLLFVNYNFVTNEQIKTFLILILPILILILFSKSVFSNMKTNIQDIAITIFGILYIPFFFMFLSLTRQMEMGEYLVWYVFIGAWISDSFAYLVGSKIGKHKFSKISPNKSIEGSVAGVLFTAIFFGIYTNFLITKGLNLNIAEMVIVGIFASIISQIGDLSASAIKRHCDIKDFGTIMPGHGGILDRFDSIILISPYIYIILQILL